MMPDDKIQEALSRIEQFCTRHCVSETVSLPPVLSPHTLKVNSVTGVPTVKDTTYQ